MVPMKNSVKLQYRVSNAVLSNLPAETTNAFLGHSIVTVTPIVSTKVMKLVAVSSFLLLLYRTRYNSYCNFYSGPSHSSRSSNHDFFKRWTNFHRHLQSSWSANTSNHVEVELASHPTQM